MYLHKRHIITGILFLFLATPALLAINKDKANKNTSSIKGVVIDKNTGETLPGVTVEVLGAKVNSFTNFDGEFTIPELEPGFYRVSVSMVSYASAYIDIFVGQEFSEVLQFELVH